MKSVKYNKNLNKILKTSITIFSVLTIINCIWIVGSSNALFEKSIDSRITINLAAYKYNACKREFCNFDYTNTRQLFIATKSGIYKLKTCGSLRRY